MEQAQVSDSALARKALADEPNDLSINDNKYVIFCVEDRHYGIDIMLVREICVWSEPTRLPNAPPHIRGVVNLRGAIVPIVDLRARFGQGVTEATEYHVMLIVTLHDRLIGLLVDSISGILSFPPDVIEPVPDLTQTSRDGLLSGLARGEEMLVALLNPDKLVDVNISALGAL